MSELPPSHMHPTIPNLQVVWDSTSFRALMFCARSYQYGMLEGWRGSAVDLEFGIYFATATETYAKGRLSGLSKIAATVAAVERVVIDSWIDTGNETDFGYGVSNGRPWGGEYQAQWRCLGETKYRNAKGHAAKCPFSHKGKWFPGDGPETCGTCGSHTHTERRYLPFDRIKNRETLVRLVEGYCNEQPEVSGGPGLYPYAFPDGTPAVELSFKLPLPFNRPDGKPYIFAGHFDKMATHGDREIFIADNKSTKSYINQLYWKQFSPNVQVDNYDLVGSIMFPHLNLSGIAIEAAQVKATGNPEFALQVFYRTEGQREETLREMGWWLKQAERYAADNYWPMNKSNCKMCAFNNICSMDPSQRDIYLKANFRKQIWNPNEER
jgi:hypothetical protein